MIKEILFKNWKRETAERLGITVHGLEQKLHKGYFPYPPLKRVNRRVLYVIVKEPQR